MSAIEGNGVDDLVQTGIVRVALFPPLFSKEAESGELGGWAVDLALALGARLGVEVLLVEYPGPGEVLEDIKAGRCDAAFLGIDRPAEADFTPPFVQFDFTCLVPAASPIHCVADADRPGIRIAAVSDHASTLALSRILKHAELVLADTPGAALDLLRSGNADVLASTRPWLLAASTQLLHSRVLEDRYGANLLAMVVPKGRAGWLACVKEFIEEAKASGAIQQAFERAGWQGVEVVPSLTSSGGGQHQGRIGAAVTGAAD